MPYVLLGFECLYYVIYEAENTFSNINTHHYLELASNDVLNVAKRTFMCMIH